jgi:hypothetical protein
MGKLNCYHAQIVAAITKMKFNFIIGCGGNLGRIWSALNFITYPVIYVDLNQVQKTQKAKPLMIGS